MGIRFNDSTVRATYVLFRNDSVVINHINLLDRKLNEKKIVKKLEVNWQVGIKLYYDNGSNVFNLNQNQNFWLDGLLPNIIIPKLHKFDAVKMDFVGATRMGDVWKGSRIVYTD